MEEKKSLPQLIKEGRSLKIVPFNGVFKASLSFIGGEQKEVCAMGDTIIGAMSKVVTKCNNSQK